MQKVENQTFIGANVQIDGGVAYVGCKFVKCNIVLTGMAPAQLSSNTWEDCRWSLAGPAANVISFLKAMFQSGAKEMVEILIREIRGETPVPANWNPASKSGGTVQ